MPTYYARATVEGTSKPQSVKVEASNGAEAKKLIAMRLGGKIKHWNNSPVAPVKPPSWFKG